MLPPPPPLPLWQALHACAPASDVAAPSWALTGQEAPAGAATAGGGGGGDGVQGGGSDGLAAPNQSVLFYGVRGQQYQARLVAARPRGS